MTRKKVHLEVSPEKSISNFSGDTALAASVQLVFLEEDRSILLGEAQPALTDDYELVSTNCEPLEDLLPLLTQALRISDGSYNCHGLVDFLAGARAKPMWIHEREVKTSGIGEVGLDSWPIPEGTNDITLTEGDHSCLFGVISGSVLVHSFVLLRNSTVLGRPDTPLVLHKPGNVVLEITDLQQMAIRYPGTEIRKRVYH
jgi:hypothetical protein